MQIWAQLANQPWWITWKYKNVKYLGLILNNIMYNQKSQKYNKINLIKMNLQNCQILASQ